MTASMPSQDEMLEFKRQAFLLEQLNSARDGKLPRAEANKKIAKQIEEELSLTTDLANDLRTAMVARDFVKELPGRIVAYTITEEGRKWLAEHRAYIPLLPAKGKVNAVSDLSIPQWRVAYLLLQLVDASNDGKTVTELNKKYGPVKLELNAATARSIRGELVLRKLITVTRAARSEKYALTPQGMAHLVTLSFDWLGKPGISGVVLTKLLHAARNRHPDSLEKAHESQLPTESRSASPPQNTSPTTKELEEAVLTTCAETRHELNTKLAPIHTVRARIRRQFGDRAASHEVFDEIVLDLRRAKRVRLISISDKGGATAEQLRDSIVSVGETFFYLETVDGSASA